MTNAPELDVFSQAKGQPRASENRPKPVSGLTLENFWASAKSFAQAAGTGFVLIRDNAWGTREFPHTPREWGAWMSYLRARRLSTIVFHQTGKATVPAQWPYLFDAAWRKELDDRAADRYEAELTRETRIAVGVIQHAARKNFIKGKLGYDPAKVRGAARFDEPEKPQQFIDKDLLLECYEADLASAKAQKAGKTA